MQRVTINRVVTGEAGQGRRGPPRVISLNGQKRLIDHGRMGIGPGEN